MASYSSYLNSHKNNLQNCCKPGSVGAQGPQGIQGPTGPANNWTNVVASYDPNVSSTSDVTISQGESVCFIYMKDYALPNDATYNYPGTGTGLWVFQYKSSSLY